MGRFFNIMAGLQSKLDSIAGHPKIVFDNDKEYSPQNGTRYWRTKLIPLRSELASVENMQKHIGVFQVDVFIKKNSGTAELMRDLDTIHDTFNSVNSVTSGDTNIQINGVGLGPVYIEQGWCRGYVEIQYMCYSL